jgi:hypothetical protein
MTGMRRLLAAACFLPCVCFAQAVPRTCADFAGSWSGTWSQGSYGTQWIHVTEVSDDCVARIAYSPYAAAPSSTALVPIKAGVMQFTCHTGTGGTCRLEIREGELQVAYTDPSGFVNNGIFRKTR